jgi:hypothetical protein
MVDSCTWHEPDASARGAYPILIFGVLKGPPVVTAETEVFFKASQRGEHLRRYRKIAAPHVTTRPQSSFPAVMQLVNVVQVLVAEPTLPGAQISANRLDVPSGHQYLVVQGGEKVAVRTNPLLGRHDVVVGEEQ